MRRTIKRTTTIVNPTLTEAFNEFLAAKERANKSEATLTNLTISMRVFRRTLEIENEDFKCEELCRDDIEDFIDALLEAEKNPNTINHYLRDIRTFINWASDEDEDRNYCRRIKINQLAVQDEGIKVYSDSQVARLLEKPSDDDDFTTWRSWAITCFILGTGARIATVIDIKLKDINFTAKQITYSHTKNKRAQTVPLSPATERYLKQYIREWRGAATEEDWLFPNVCEEQLSANAAKIAYKKYCNARGVDKTSLHGLRHTFASKYIASGGNPAKLQIILGHSSPTMTSHYVRLFGTDLATGIENYSALDTATKEKSRTKKVTRGE